MRDEKNILIIAAENSAENYAVQVVKQFQRKKSPVKFFGVGGDQLAREGVDIIIHNKELAVVGIIEVISSLPRLKKCRDILFKTALERKADAVLLIDYPDFNLRIAGKFKKAGIPVYYYICPTVWAWRYSRVNLIKKYVHRLFIIFPFEIPIFEKEKIPFTYTGHPLIPGVRVEMEKKEFRERLAVPNESLVITLMPGSRKSEILSLLPGMLKTAELLVDKFDIRFFLLKANGIGVDLLLPHLGRCPVKVGIINQEAGYDLINASDVVLTTCGTSNLEIALLGVPFTAVYRVNRLSYFLGKPFVKINLYSIVNILAGKEVIKELIQDDFTPANMAREIKRLLTQPGVRENMEAEFKSIRRMLSQDVQPAGIIYEKIIGDIFPSQREK